jgi:hypothetical protein
MCYDSRILKTRTTTVIPRITNSKFISFRKTRVIRHICDVDSRFNSLLFYFHLMKLSLSSTLGWEVRITPCYSILVLSKTAEPNHRYISILPSQSRCFVSLATETKPPTSTCIGQRSTAECKSSRSQLMLPKWPDGHLSTILRARSCKGHAVNALNKYGTAKCSEEWIAGVPMTDSEHKYPLAYLNITCWSYTKSCVSRQCVVADPGRSPIWNAIAEVHLRPGTCVPWFES